MWYDFPQLRLVFLDSNFSWIWEQSETQVRPFRGVCSVWNGTKCPYMFLWYYTRLIMQQLRLVYSGPVHTDRHRHCQRKKCYVDGQKDMQPLLPITVPVKKIKGADRQCNVVTLGVNRPLKIRPNTCTAKETSLVVRFALCTFEMERRTLHIWDAIIRR